VLPCFEVPVVCLLSSPPDWCIVICFSALQCVSVLCSAPVRLQVLSLDWFVCVCVCVGVWVGVSVGGCVRVCVS